MNIAKLAIERPVFIVMIVMSIITLGVLGYMRLPVDLMPNVEFPTLVVVTSYPGASAEEIESIITRPMENALGAVEGLDTLSSTSREGASVVFISLRMGVDVKFAELKVRQKVAQAMAQLPPDVNEPRINRFSTDDAPILYFSIQGNRTLPQLREIIENDVQPRLEAVPGVGSIGISGAQKRIVSISVNPGLLAASGLSYQQIVTAVNRKNVSVPIGTVRTEGRNISVRVYGKSENVDDFGDIQLTTTTGRILRVRDIADVKIALEDETERVRVGKKNAVLFFVYKQSGENTVRISEDSQKAMDEIRKDLPGDVKVQVVSDTAVSIKRAVKGVQEDIVVGALLAIVIVWLFLGNLRSTLITAVALPNSIIGAFMLVSGAGFSLNTMTLLSLSLAVGLLIDDSIVVRENIFRYIEKGLDPKAAAEKGTNEVALAVLSTTLSIMAVFIPISFLQGVIGQFFREFGLTVAFALIISLVDAFTTAPMLSAYWFKHTEQKDRRGIGAILGGLSVAWNQFYVRLNAFYLRTLEWSLNHKKTVVSFVGVLFIGSFILSRFIGGSFMAAGDSGVFGISLETYPGAPLTVIDGYVRQVEDKLLADPEIVTVYSQVGGGQSHTANINVELQEIKKRKTTTQKKIQEIRGWLKSKFDKDLVYRLNERSSVAGGPGGGGGFGAALQINITGPDLRVLQDLSDKVQQVMSGVPGVSDPNSTMKPGSPELVIRVDEIKAEKLGSSALELGGALRDMLVGLRISTFTKDNQDYDVMVRLNPDSKKTLRDIENLTVTTRSGKRVPVAGFCTFEIGSTPLEIRRESKQRLVRLSANLMPGYSMSDMVKRVDAAVAAKVVFPDGYRYAFGGQQKQFADLGKQMGMAFLLAIIFMYMILASLYNSFHQPLVLMVSIPLAIIGAFLALLITGTELDLYGYIGLILVLGLVAKNAILLIDFTNHNRTEGMSIREALLHAGPVRLRPILMTSFAMIFGMLPLALGLNEGSRGRQALPVSVIGGILTSTFLTLLVVPIFYEKVEQMVEKHEEKKAAKKALAHRGY